MGNIPIFYTDGSQKREGSGSAYYVNSQCKESDSNGFDPETPMTAELFAIYMAIKRARRERQTHILIISDSKTSIDGIMSNGLTSSGRRRVHYSLYKKIRRYMMSCDIKVFSS